MSNQHFRLLSSSTDYLRDIKDHERNIVGDGEGTLVYRESVYPMMDIERILTTRIRVDLPVLVHRRAMPPDDSNDANVGKHGSELSPFDNLLLLETESARRSEQRLGKELHENVSTYVIR